MGIEDYNTKQIEIPVIPLRGMWIFPHMVIHFDVGRETSLKALEQAMIDNSRVLLVSQKDFKVDEPTIEDLYNMGTVAVIKQTLKLPNDNLRVLVEGVSRAEIDELKSNGHLTATATEYVDHDDPIEIDEEMNAIKRLVLDDVKDYIGLSSQLSPEIMFGLMDIEHPGRLADVIASYLQVKLEDHMQILSELDYYKRLETLHVVLKNEIAILKLEEKINRKVKKQLDKIQKEYYLKEQLNAIRDELGEEESAEDYIEEYFEKLDRLKLPKNIEDSVRKEIRRIRSMSPASPELNISRTYIEYVLDLPWKKETKDIFDIAKSRKILNEDHYGLEKVKERVLEFIAVKKMTKTMAGPILCLVGPPGVGKTSIARSIARSMGRNFVSMRLGGVRDEAEIRGHRKTYIGAMPGRIITSMQKAKSINPVFLLDEIDKVSSDFRGDPASALLEVLDPAQNDEFVDHYLDLPYDLSKVMFITTANSTSTIPSALLDRMEIIRVSGYTAEEKFHIAKGHLIPRNLKSHGLAPASFKMTDEALRILIDSYTRESGVRNLERVLSKVIRRAIKHIVEKNVKSVRVNKTNLEKFADQPKFIRSEMDRENSVGVVTGLAWTEVGGEILQIEANTMPGTGKIQLTGQLGNVMKESAMAGLSYIRSHYESFGLEEDFYKTIDIHIHIPEGAIPKDGPSAGISMTTAMLSALTKDKILSSIAMTGEITLTGRVLPIGGVKEKVLAAKRQGIAMVILPNENRRDVEQLESKITQDMQFEFVKDIKDVIELAFEE